MADLLVFTRATSRVPGRGWQDGDIVAAISRRRLRARWARNLWRLAPPTNPVLVRHAQGEYQGGGLHEEIHKTFHRVSVRQVSATEAEYTVPGFAPFVVGPTPVAHPETGKQVWIHLDDFLRARRASGKRLFRDPGTGEIRWYQQEILIPSKTALDTLWQTLWDGKDWQSGGHRPPERYPFGRGDTQHHLPLYVRDFDEAREREWRDAPISRRMATLGDAIAGTGEARRYRANRCEYTVDWRALTGMSAAHQSKVLDKRLPFDRRRDHQPYPLSIVGHK